ncbi:PIN domain-containing protein [Deinococcus gobiensis]|uniref:PIN domain-containing protein n=1 Tax=Deinococcus gobiensis TaxID=502394 RepID=UPI001461612D|nr:PIN domain-containing protein [Deinococcus gobiensis]
MQDLNIEQDVRLMFDTNVWMFLIGPQIPEDRAEVHDYSQLLSDLLQRSIKIFCSDIIISELINQHIKFNLSRYKSTVDKRASPKEYRRSQNFIDDIQGILAALEIIKMETIILPTMLDNAKLENMFLDMQTGNNDFNDLIIAQTCLENNIKIVTHDYDYHGYDLDIVTVNQRLLYRPQV